MREQEDERTAALELLEGGRVSKRDQKSGKKEGRQDKRIMKVEMGRWMAVSRA